MSLELFDLEIWMNGIVQIFLLVILGLLVATTVFSYLLWQKGEEHMFYKFLGYLCGSIGCVGGVIASIQLIHGTEAVFVLGLFILMFALLAGAGIRIYRFIYDKWILKEEKA